MSAKNTPSDFKKLGKPLDGRKNYDGLLRRLPWGMTYASPEAALAAWHANMCGAPDKTRKIIARSVKAGRPLVVTIIQREQSPDGRTVDIPILTVDTRVTKSGAV